MSIAEKVGNLGIVVKGTVLRIGKEKKDSNET
jgi:hypothetical protein